MSDDTKGLLLRAVLAAPDDDAPRLVFADWLDEVGETERAEFIRIQVEMEGRPRPAFGRNRKLYDALRRRERELYGEPGGVCRRCAWHAPIPHGGWAWRLRRGFVEVLTCTAADWLSHADAILVQQPIREVRLTTWPHGLNEDELERRWPGVKLTLPSPEITATFGPAAQGNLITVHEAS